MGNCIYQIRDDISGHLLAEETAREAVISILSGRNPANYVILRLTPLTSEIRSIMNAKIWLRRQEDGKE